MAFPKRFALSTLLLLMLVVASAFGYAQWRRQCIIASVEALNAIDGTILLGKGVTTTTISVLPPFILHYDFLPSVTVGHDTNDSPILFVSVRGGVPISFAKLGEGRYSVGDGREYTFEEIRNELSRIQSLIEAVGLENVELRQYDERADLLGPEEVFVEHTIGGRTTRLLTRLRPNRRLAHSNGDE